MARPLDEIRAFHEDMTSWRRDFHAHPEIGFEEERTSAAVAAKLEEFGCEVHRNVGRTGVVGVLRAGNAPHSVGLRADMDALPILEANDLPYRSRRDGRMHACGHDGHTTMLLGAAKYLASTRNFDGTVNFIFQPAEEGLGGARAMLEDDLFGRFPCDFVYGMHNMPGHPVGTFAIRPGAMMAAGAFFDIFIDGKGSHGARPEDGVDPVIFADVAAEIVGESNVNRKRSRVLGSEDFSFMLEARPGAYINVGNGTEGSHAAPLHNPRYDFNDAVLPFGAAAFAALVERKLARMGNSG